MEMVHWFTEKFKKMRESTEMRGDESLSFYSYRHVRGSFISHSRVLLVERHGSIFGGLWQKWSVRVILYTDSCFFSRFAVVDTEERLCRTPSHWKS